MDTNRDIHITETKKGASPREIAIAVIAEKLHIPQANVTDDLELGPMRSDIAQVLCFKVGKTIVANAGMRARDIFSQL